MIDAPLALAFGAGLVATVNPCGFAMLPAYMSYFIGLGEEEESGRAGNLRRALLIGAVMASAFLLVFGIAGVLITAGFRAVIDWIPWIALLIGVGIAVLGVAMLRGFELVVALPKAKSANKGKGLRSVFGFGVSYALASLSCTLPVFLSVVAGQVTRTDFVSGVATFLAYGLGMALVLLSLTITMAMGKQSVVRWMRGSARYINRVSGAILVLAGAYVVWFWATDLASGADALNDSGAFGFVENLSQRAFELVGGNVAVWGLGLGAIVVAALVYVLLRPDDVESPPDEDALIAAGHGDD